MAVWKARKCEFDPQLIWTLTWRTDDWRLPPAKRANAERLLRNCRALMRWQRAKAEEESSPDLS